MPDIKNILKQVQEGTISIEVAEKLLSAKIIEEIGDLAKLDINRVIRTGIPEVLYAQDKNPELVLEIIHSFLKKNNFCIVSRYTKSQKNRIIKKFQNSEKYDLKDQLSRSCKTIPRLIAEGYAKRHQKRGFQKYLDDAMGECNEIIVSLSHCRDIYPKYVSIKLCDELIKTYDVSGRQLYRLSETWSKFKMKGREQSS